MTSNPIHCSRTSSGRELLVRGTSGHQSSDRDLALTAAAGEMIMSNRNNPGEPPAVKLRDPEAAGAHPDGTAQAASPPPPRAALSFRVKAIAAALTLAVIAAAGLAYCRYSTLHPSTDDAYVGANVVRIAPLVAGRISEVSV